MFQSNSPKPKHIEFLLSGQTGTLCRIDLKGKDPRCDDHAGSGSTIWSLRLLLLVTMECGWDMDSAWFSYLLHISQSKQNVSDGSKMFWKIWQPKALLGRTHVHMLFFYTSSSLISVMKLNGCQT